MKQYNQHQQKEKRNVRIAGAAMCLLLFGTALFCGGYSIGKSGKETVTKAPTATPTPKAKPKNWMLRMLADGRTEVSMPVKTAPGADSQIPISVSKTVRLGDFECTMTVPQDNFRLSDLQNGTAVLESTSVLRYMGEKDSIKISCRNMGLLSSVIDSSGNTESSTRYEDEVEIVLKREEDKMFLRKIYGEFSKEIESAGAGILVTEVEFRILDENGEGTEEQWEYRLVIPFDVVEK